MKNYRFIGTLMHGLLSLTLMLSSCGSGGGNGGKTPSFSSVTNQAGGISVSDKIPLLRVISITPSNPLGINPGTQLQFAAAGIYSDNSVQDLTTKVVWTSSDTSIVSVSNEPDSMGLATTVARGYCSISASLGGVSGSTIIGVN